MYEKQLSQNTGSKNEINLWSAELAGYANPLKFVSELEIWAKLLAKSTKPWTLVNYSAILLYF